MVIASKLDQFDDHCAHHEVERITRRKLFLPAIGPSFCFLPTGLNCSVCCFAIIHSIRLPLLVGLLSSSF